MSYPTNEIRNRDLARVPYTSRGGSSMIKFRTIHGVYEDRLTYVVGVAICATPSRVASQARYVSPAEIRPAANRCSTICKYSKLSSMSNKASILNAERAERAVKQQDCVTQALINGCKGAAWALATAGIVVSAANKYSPTFRKALGVSGKAGLVVRSLL